MTSRATPSWRPSACCSCSRARRSSRSRRTTASTIISIRRCSIVGFTFAANRVLAFGVACAFGLAIWLILHARASAPPCGRSRSIRQARVSSAIDATAMSAMAFAGGGALVAVAGTLVSTFLTFNPVDRRRVHHEGAGRGDDGRGRQHGGQSARGHSAGRRRIALLVSRRFRSHPGGCLFPVPVVLLVRPRGLFGTP